MKPQRTAALIASRALSGTSFARFPGINQHISHVIAPTYRQASRIANSMSRAKACRSVADAVEARIFLAVGVRDVASLLPSWRGKVVLLADDAGDITDLLEKGAAVAKVTVFDEIRPCCFFLEGDAPVVKVAASFLQEAGGRAVPMGRGSSAHVDALIRLTGPLLLALLESATIHLREADIPLGTARDIIGKAVTNTLRAHQRSGAKTWASHETGALTHLVGQLERSNPALAAYLRVTEQASEEVIRQGRVQTFGFGGGKSLAGHTD
jgi:hypothetical protein